MGVDEDGLPISLQEQLDIIAIESFHAARWGPTFRMPCDPCRQDHHEDCRRWHHVRLPAALPVISLAPSPLPAGVLELWLCGCTCPTAKQLQWLKSEPEAARS